MNLSMQKGKQAEQEFHSQEQDRKQVEEELFYSDWDHRIAHGIGQRMRSQTLLAKPELARRTRRSSHDDTAKPRKFILDVEQTKKDILAQEDTDGDFQITVHDAGPKSFTVGTADSQGFRKHEIRGTYALSNLLQELALASEYGRKSIWIDETRLNENPVDRLHRLIKYHFWDALTRRIDATGLEKICADPKNKSDSRNRIYVPYHDDFAWDYYTTVSSCRPHLNLDVVRLPEIITPLYVKSINSSPGILSLGLRQVRDVATGDVVIRGTPFVVPGGRFNEMYGWDSYFEALGLLQDDRVELARGMVENFWYEIEHYGKILNANRSYYLTRSQPPFLSDMTLQVYEKLRFKEWSDIDLSVWFSKGLRASLKELFSVWMSSPRLDGKVGLSKYHPEGLGMPPETESTHFNHILEPFAVKAGMTLSEYTEKYNSGELSEPELDQYFIHDRAVRESGHDTTYRFEKRCAHLATIDLNALLYKYMVDLTNCSLVVRVRRGPSDVYLLDFLKWIELLREKGVEGMIGNDGGWDSSWAKGILIFDSELDVAGSKESFLKNMPEKPSLVPSFDIPAESMFFTIYLTSSLFDALAVKWKTLVDQYLWNPTDSLYYDWDCEKGEQSVYETVTTFWALWAGLASESQASKMVPYALSRFEMTGGIVSGTEDSRGKIGIDRPNRQWDFPFGWSPHQMLAWAGLYRYGFIDEASRICYRWMYTLTSSFVDYNGVVPEKFDVVNMTHRFSVEYGNVGTDFRLVVKEVFADQTRDLVGWTRRIKSV